jgi:hypothetical protein
LFKVLKTMDSFRRPEMIIAIITIIAVIALGVYFYRRASLFQEEMNKQGERFSAVVKKVSEMPQQNHFTQVVEKIKQQEGIIFEQGKTIEYLTDEIEDFRFVLEKLNKPIEEATGHKIEFPYKKKSKKKVKVVVPKKKNHRRRKYESESESSSSSESEEEVKPVKKKKEKEEENTNDDDMLEKKIAAARNAKK